MGICVFVGPTLEVGEARAVLDATYLPPASQGDVFRLVASSDVRVIAIIDGNFQQVPAVWHKEILWAMSQGVHVLGAASMGALRAAELADFGVVGAGRIFAAYRCGLLSPYDDEPFEDDDEVAVIHGPVELGYPALSEALVDIRCTLDLASTKGVISTELRDRLASLAKSCFYASRTYATLLDLAEKNGIGTPVLTALRNWLPSGRMSQKRQDAMSLLSEISCGNFVAAKQVSYDFHHTTMWDHLTTAAFVGQSISMDLQLPAEDCDVLAEVRLCPAEFYTLKREAEDRLRIGSCPPVLKVARTMLNILRQRGRFAHFAARAAGKKAALAVHEAPRASDLIGLQELQLLDWYFGRRLGLDQPDDLGAFAHSLGYCDRQALANAVLREYVFVTSGACSD